MNDIVTAITDGTMASAVKALSYLDQEFLSSHGWMRTWEFAWYKDSGTPL